VQLNQYICGYQVVRFLYGWAIVNINYYDRKSIVTEFDEFHLLGIVCIYLSSKLGDTSPISLNDLYFNICHKKYSKNQILESELKVLRTLGFEINDWCVYKICLVTLKNSAKFEVLIIKYDSSSTNRTK